MRSSRPRRQRRHSCWVRKWTIRWRCISTTSTPSPPISRAFRDSMFRAGCRRNGCRSVSNCSAPTGPNRLYSNSLTRMKRRGLSPNGRLFMLSDACNLQAIRADSHHLPAKSKRSEGKPSGPDRSAETFIGLKLSALCVGARRLMLQVSAGAVLSDLVRNQISGENLHDILRRSHYRRHIESDVHGPGTVPSS